MTKFRTWMGGLAPTKQNFSFIATMTCIFGLLALAYFKDVDINASLPVILGTYLAARTVQKGSAHMAARGGNTDLRGLINDIEHGQRPEPPTE